MRCTARRARARARAALTARSLTLSAALGRAQFDLAQPPLFPPRRHAPQPDDDGGDARAPAAAGAAAARDGVQRHAALVALLRFTLALRVDEWALPLASILCDAASVGAVFERRPELAAEPVRDAVLGSLRACGVHASIFEWAAAHLRLNSETIT